MSLIHSTASSQLACSSQQTTLSYSTMLLKARIAISLLMVVICSVAGLSETLEQDDNQRQIVLGNPLEALGQLGQFGPLGQQLGLLGQLGPFGQLGPLIQSGPLGPLSNLISPNQGQLNGQQIEFFSQLCGLLPCQQLMAPQNRQMSAPYAVPPTPAPYAAYSTPAPYAAYSTSAPYAAPSTLAPYTPYSTQASYSVPPTQAPYGAAPTPAPYAAPTPALYTASPMNYPAPAVAPYGSAGSYRTTLRPYMSK